MSDSDDGKESFEVNDFDLNAALNPGAKWRRPTKEQQIYGMWAGNESDDDENNSGRRGFGARNRNDKYSASGPVKFVSGGVNKPDNVRSAENATSEMASKTEDDDVSIDLRPHKKAPKPTVSGMGSNSRTMNTSEFAGLRSSGGGASGDIGNWEKHTRGIGMKILQKMGYESGKGLGSKGEGIVTPVEATLRPGRAAVGAYGPEHKKPKIKRGDDKPGVHSDEDEDENEQAAAGRWRKDGAAKGRYKFRTIDEVIADGGTMHKRLQHVVEAKHSSKVIDMTGKKQRVYSGYDSFTTKSTSLAPIDNDIIDTTTKKRAFDVPELTHNLHLLLEMSEEEIVRQDRRRRHLQDQRVALVHERQSMQASMEIEKDNNDRMKQCINLVELFGKRANSNDLTMDECFEFFTTLITDYYQEYKLFDLDTLIVSTVLPLMNRTLYPSNWNILDECDRGLSVLQKWRELIDSEHSQQIQYRQNRQKNVDIGNNMHPYHRMIWESWMPHVRRHIRETWRPKLDCEALIDFIQLWLPMLPKWIVDNILEQCVIPRINDEVERWDPQTDTIPLHSWLHPWLPLMSELLQPIYAPIRHKLGKALTLWNPTDASAKLILQPWKKVFKPGVMDAFLAQYVVPKLANMMSTFSINPANQQLTEWHALMTWLGFVSAQNIANILQKNFFPKWHQALFMWLSCPNPNFQEISQWYQGWKSLFPVELIEITHINHQFTRALEQMNRCVHGAPPQPPTAPALASSPPPTSAQATPAVPSLPTMSFKDLVERRAVDNGLTFMPVPGKMRETKQVYWFGPAQIYIDRNVLFALSEQSIRWEPTSLESLLARVAGHPPPL